jgi:hypothetical protein
MEKKQKENYRGRCWQGTWKGGRHLDLNTPK